MVFCLWFMVLQVEHTANSSLLLVEQVAAYYKTVRLFNLKNQKP